jgi:hypothetical protein
MADLSPLNSAQGWSLRAYRLRGENRFSDGSMHFANYSKTGSYVESIFLIATLVGNEEGNEEFCSTKKRFNAKSCARA